MPILIEASHKFVRTQRVDHACRRWCLDGQVALLGPAGRGSQTSFGSPASGQRSQEQGSQRTTY